MTDHHPGQFISINTFTAVEGGIDALAAFQISEMQDMSDEAAAHGWLGNQVYRSLDGASLVVLTRFRSAVARERWAQTDRFRQHVDDLEPLIQDVTSIPVSFLAAHGEGGPPTGDSKADHTVWY
jgi:heme-degrading monooxygenase HmoA